MNNGVLLLLFRVGQVVDNLYAYVRSHITLAIDFNMLRNEGEAILTYSLIAFLYLRACT